MRSGKSFLGRENDYHVFVSLVESAVSISCVQVYDHLSYAGTWDCASRVLQALVISVLNSVRVYSRVVMDRVVEIITA